MVELVMGVKVIKVVVVERMVANHHPGHEMTKCLQAMMSSPSPSPQCHPPCRFWGCGG